METNFKEHNLPNEQIQGNTNLYKREIEEDNFNQIKLEYIKSYLDSQLDNMGVYKKLMKNFDNDDLNDEDTLLKKLNDEGIVENIIENLGKWGEDNIVKIQSKSQKGLFIKISSCTDFMDFVKPDSNTKLGIDILFLGQRFQTNPVFVNTEMVIEQGFFLDFNPTKLNTNLDLDNLLHLSSPIHLVIYLIKTDSVNINSTNNNVNNLYSSQEVISLYATKTIEWRSVLAYGAWKVKANINSSLEFNKTNSGVININLSLLPLVEKKKLLPEKIVQDHLNTEKRYLSQSHQEFVKFSSDWWEHYKNIRVSHASRIIKLFVNTEDRESFSYKPGSSLLFPITTGRSLSTPHDAARFVSLIPFKQNTDLNNSKVECFNSIHTFLTLKKGDVEDHCTLLCNILLGFGLDAYVAIGISINGPHCWVITRGVTEVNTNSNIINNSISNNINKNTLNNITKVYNITFWESLTGQRIEVSDPKVFRFYKKIHCVFSDKAFYANVQPDDTVFNTSYVFENETLWKNIPQEKIESLQKYDFSPELCLTNVITDIHKLEINLENDLKTRVLHYRKSLEMSSQFDNRLSYLLSPALCNYELERVSNSTYGNEEFKQSIKNYVPEGYTFKAFPCHSTIMDANTFFSSCITSEIGKDILYSRGDNTNFAVRCKIYQYPQSILSCWVMFAVKYRPIK
jgi:centrosomal protein CEP76